MDISNYIHHDKFTIPYLNNFTIILFICHSTVLYLSNARKLDTTNTVHADVTGNALILAPF